MSERQSPAPHRWLFMATILPLVVLFYLDSAKVKTAFGLDE